MTKSFKIGGREIGGNAPMYVIAEVSCNHEGNIKEARRIIEAAGAAGADAVKLQTYTADTISVKKANVADGTMWSTIDLHSLYDKAQTPWEWHSELKKVADDFGMHLFSSPFDETAVDFLVDQGVPVLKVASFEAVDIKLLQKMAQTKLPVIISNGMTDFLELDEAYRTLGGYTRNDIAMLHCNSGYPASFDECNLATIPAIESIFDCVVGLSDHTIYSNDKDCLDPIPHVAPLEALRLGAKVLEVHLTMDREEGRRLHRENKGGFDWAFSRNPDEFRRMMNIIREYEKTARYEYESEIEKKAAQRALGTVFFEPTEKEIASRKLRPSLWVVDDMKPGDVFKFKGGKPGNFDSLRPAGGLHIRFADLVNGKTASSHIPAGTPLSWQLVNLLK